MDAFLELPVLQEAFVQHVLQDDICSSQFLLMNEYMIYMSIEQAKHYPKRYNQHMSPVWFPEK